jgi:hypothetical protein
MIASNKQRLGGRMRRQRGVTMIGWIFLLIPMAITLYAAIRVAPEYMNYYKVVQAMQKTASQMKGDDTLSPQSVRRALEKQFDTGYVDNPKAKDIAVARGPMGWTMTADYEKAVPLFGNLHLLLVFNKSVPIN